MLSRIVSEHKEQHDDLVFQVEQRKQNAKESLREMTGQLMDDVNANVSVAFQNQQQIEQQLQQCEAQCKQLAKTTSAYATMLSNFTSSLKQLGDVEQWTTTIQNDMNSIADVLVTIHKNSSNPQ